MVFTMHFLWIRHGHTGKGNVIMSVKYRHYNIAHWFSLYTAKIPGAQFPPEGYHVLRTWYTVCKILNSFL